MDKTAETRPVTCTLDGGVEVIFDIVDVPSLPEDTSWQDQVVSVFGK